MTARGGSGHDGVTMSVRALSLAFRQMFHPATLRLVALCAVLTLALFGLLGLALWYFVFAPYLPKWFGADGADMAVGMALLTVVFGGWFLFRAVAMAVMGLFTDGVVASVEEEHYPDVAAHARHVDFKTGLRLGLRSALRAVGWNALAAPLYIALLITGFGTILLVLLVNALILGKDFEAMVAARHPDGPAHPLSGRQRFALGLATSALFLIPVLNLFAPVFGAALAVHILHMKPDPLS